MTELANKVCGPCNNLTPHLTADQIAEFSNQVPNWEVREGPKLYRKWKLKDFAEALAFVNKIGTVAETENHHPSINFGWGFVEVTTWTHAIKGLSENDFILAAKIDALA
jgi:4a-hydroxytetrahydrobiopterin dehydratase